MGRFRMLAGFLRKVSQKARTAGSGIPLLLRDFGIHPTIESLTLAGAVSISAPHAMAARELAELEPYILAFFDYPHVLIDAI